MVNTMSATSGPSSGARGRAGIAAATTEARHGLTFRDDSTRITLPLRRRPIAVFDPCGAGMPWTVIWMSGMAGLLFDVDDGDVGVEGEPPAVACAVPAGEHQAVVGAVFDHFLVADQASGVAVAFPVGGVGLDAPAELCGFLGGELVGGAVWIERPVWLVPLAVAVNEDDLIGSGPVDVEAGQELQGPGDGGPVGVVTATSH